LDLFLSSSKYSLIDSIQSKNFPKVDDKSNKTNIKSYTNVGVSSTKNNPISNTSSKQSQITGSTQKIQSYNFDSLNGSLTTSIDQKSSQYNASQEKERNSRNYQNDNSIQKGKNVNIQNSNSSQPLSNISTNKNGLNIQNGINNKNISLLF
jgi:hypothetical protein